MFLEKFFVFLVHGVGKKSIFKLTQISLFSVDKYGFFECVFIDGFWVCLLCGVEKRGFLS